MDRDDARENYRSTVRMVPGLPELEGAGLSGLLVIASEAGSGLRVPRSET